MLAGRLRFLSLRNLPCHRIVFSELVVDEHNTFKLQFSQPTFVSIASRLEFLHCGFPFAFDVFVTKSTEAHTPAFEDDHLDRRFTLAVADLPLACRKSVSRARESRLVIRRDLNVVLAVRDSCKCFDTELYIVSRRLATMLYEWVVGLRFCECFLFVMWKVEIVYRED